MAEHNRSPPLTSGHRLDILARTVLAPWVERGVDQDDVHRALLAEPSCTLLRYDGGQWLVARPGSGGANCRPEPTAQAQEPWWRTRRRNAMVRMVINATDRLEKVPQGAELVVCPGDCISGTPAAGAAYPWRYPNSTRGDASDVPVFSLIGCAGSWNIPFPVFMNRSHEDDSLEGWDAFRGLITNMSRASPLHTRVPQAVFRGGTQGKSCWTGEPGSEIAVHRNAQALHCGRRALRKKMLEPDTRALYNVGYDFLDARSQLQYQAVLYAEGHCGWADRGRFMLHMGSVLLWQETMCREWYTMLLEPWVHYVPLDYHLTNLHAAAHWALDPDNSRHVRRIVDNLRTYVEEMLSTEAIITYAAALLREYMQNALRYNAATESALNTSRTQASRPLTTCIEPALAYLERTRPFEGIRS